MAASRPGAIVRWGAFMARHRRWVAVAWVLILVGAGYLNGVYKKDVYKKSVSDSFRIPNADSQNAYDLLESRLGSQNAAGATVVFSVPSDQQRSDSANATVVAAAIEALAAVPGVASAPDPLTQSPRATLANVAGRLPADEAGAVLDLAQDLPPSVSANGRVAYTSVTFRQSLPDLLEQYPVNPDEAAADDDNPNSQLHVA